VDHPLRPVSTNLPPGFWRTAAVVASVVAAVELVLLAVTGSALLFRHSGSPAARHRTAPPAAHQPTHVKATAGHRAAPPAAKLARGKVGVMVLNGNGRQGAAAAAATRVRRHGYRIRLVGNAPHMTYRSSIVMYRPGFEAEGRRLARDLGIRLVGPIDGIRPAQLHGAQAVLIIGT
jgi:hypothetical protein